jgi:hypothetical protein
MRGLEWGTATTTNLLQLVNEVNCVSFDFLIRVVKSSFDNLVHNMIIAYRMGESDQWGVASRGKRHHSHQ